MSEIKAVEVAFVSPEWELFAVLIKDEISVGLESTLELDRYVKDETIVEDEAIVEDDFPTYDDAVV